MRREGLLLRYLHYPLIILAALAAAAVVAASLARQLSYRQTVEGLRRTAGLARALVELTEPEGLDRLCKRIGTESLRITLIRLDGTVLGDSEREPAAMENHLDRQEFLAARQGREGLASRFSASVGRKMIYLALPVMEHRGVRLAVRVSMPEQNLRSELGRLYGRLALAGLALLAVLTALTLIVERRMLDPIASLQAGARAFAAGDLAHTLHVRHPRDLRAVAESLNRMAGTLRQRIAEVTSQRNELAAILAGMVEGVVVLDGGLAIREANPSALRLAGCTPAQALGRNLLEVFRSTRLHDLAREAQATGGPLEAGITLQAERSLALQVHATRLPEDRVVLVLNDITRLETLETMRRDFVANVSHELKTPITAIKGSLETLLGGALEDPEVSRRFLAVAARHGDRLAAIVDDLLSLSRLELQAEASLEKQPSPLEPIARAAMQLCQGKADGRGISLELNAEEGIAAPVNPPLLEQALTNLVDNAVKYSNQGGLVQIDVRRGEGRRCASRFATRASASRRRTCPACSSASTGWTGPAAASWAAPGWAWPSSSTSCWPTGAACGPKACPARAASSPSSFRGSKIDPWTPCCCTPPCPRPATFWPR